MDPRLLAVLSELAAVDGTASNAAELFKSLQERAQSLLTSPSAVVSPLLSVAASPLTPLTNISDATSVGADGSIVNSPWDAHSLGAVSLPDAKPAALVHIGFLIAEPLCIQNPDGSLAATDPVDWRSEKKLIIKALVEANRSVKVRFDVGTVDSMRVSHPVCCGISQDVPAASVSNVQALLDHGCEVLHFSGHGGIEPFDHILLEDDQVGPVVVLSCVGLPDASLCCSRDLPMLSI
jgi:hypothetical protein